MIEVETVRLALPLKTKFSVAKGEADTKTNVIAILNNRYSGEAAASVQYGPTIEEIEKDLRKGIGHLKRRKNLDLETLQAISRYKIHPIARSALTGMVLNYISGETHRYPWEILSLGAPVGIRNSNTISIDAPTAVIDAIIASTCSVVKVKLGSEYDKEVIELLKDIENKEIRIDANGGWEPGKAEEMIYYLDKQGVTVIEQPTDIEHISDWPHLKPKDSEVELILDEGLETPSDYDRYAAHVDGVNIKMEKSGGIIDASRIASIARQDGKKVMLGCMVESSIGIAQSVYMSSLADYHDLDAPQLLENDIANGIVYEKDTIVVDREIIGGPSLRRELVEKYIRD